MNKRIWIPLSAIAVLLVAALVGFQVLPHLRSYNPLLKGPPVTVDLSKDPNSPFGAPVAVNYPNTLQILQRKGYTLAYDNVRLNPAWVVYRVFPVDPINIKKLPPRPSKFMPDAEAAEPLPTEAFNNSGYQRGHAAPNRAIASRYGVEAQVETFLTTNVMPQLPSLNMGSWETLEENISNNWGQRFSNVWVIVGPVFTSPSPKYLSRRHPVVIPDSFYMVVLTLRKAEPQVRAYLFPANAPKGANPETYRVSVKTVETATGLNFFPNLPQPLQTELEATIDTVKW